MKIVHVCITSAFSEIYAYQENLLSHYHRLMGHEVTIIASVFCRVGQNETESAGVRFLSDGIKLIRLVPLINNKTIVDHLHLVKGLKKTIFAETPDLLFVHNVGCFNYICLNSIKRNNPQIRIVFDNHSDYINSLHSPITRILHKCLYKHLLIPHLIKVTEWFYGVTPSRCVFLHEVYGIPSNKIKLLVMGADNANMMFEQRSLLRKDVRERYGIRKDDFLIVTGGKIDRQKNIHVFAEAINELQFDNVKLLIFGKIGEDVQSVFNELSSPNIIKIGWVNSNKVYELFYAADLVVFPGLHSVLWEQAVASKTPCAVSYIKGFEHVNVNNNCILMKGVDVEYYKKMIIELLNNPNFYKELKSNAASSKTELFYYSNIAEQVLDDIS